jgi:putative peptidoglycan lipid II flippase
MANQNRAIEFGLLFSLPAALALWQLAEPMIRVLFERGQFRPDDTLRTASALAALAIGLPAFVVVKALTPGFFAREDTRTPLNVAIVAISANIALNAVFLFYSTLHQVGIALASSLAGWLNAALLGAILMHRGHLKLDSRLLSRSARMVAATVGMGIALWLTLLLLRPVMAHSDLGGFAGLAAICVVGMLAYGLLGAALRIVNISELRFVMRRQAGVRPTAPDEPQ